MKELIEQKFYQTNGFVASSFKCEGQNSCDDLIPNPVLNIPFFNVCIFTFLGVLAGTGFEHAACEAAGSTHQVRTRYLLLGSVISVFCSPSLRDQNDRPILEMSIFLDLKFLNV